MTTTTRKKTVRVTATTTLSRQQVLDKMLAAGRMRYPGMQPYHAEEIMNLFERVIVPRALEPEARRRYYPTTAELAIVEPFMDAIMPHGTESVPGSGSAHAALERYLGDQQGAAVRIIHSRQERGGDQHCTVDTIIDVVKP